MSILNTKNSFNTFSSQKNLRNTGCTFKGLEKEEIVFPLTDDEILDLAVKKPTNDMKQVRKNALTTMFVTIPVVDSLYAGLIQKGALASKLAKSALQLGRWGAIGAIAAGVFGLKHAVNKHSKKLDNLNKNQHAASFGIDMAALCAAWTGATLLAVKGLSKIKKTFPGFVKNINKNVKTPMKKAINDSLLNKKFVNSFENFVSKKAYARLAMKAVSFVMAPILAISAFVRVKKEAKKQEMNIISNYLLLNHVNNIAKTQMPEA